MKKSKSRKAPKKKTQKPVRKNKAGISPVGDRILVKPFGLEEGMVTSFGIIIPDSAKEKPEQGKVVAVGPGKKGEDGKLIPVSVKVGDKVMFSKYGYDEIKVDGTEYYLVREENILAILN
jgi:chaperonin GroES